MCAELAPETFRLDVVDEGALAVDLDDRKELAIPSLELSIAGDVDLAKSEVEFLLKRDQGLPGTPAQMTASGVVEHDVPHLTRGTGSNAPPLRHGYSPRVIVASATRSTATP